MMTGRTRQSIGDLGENLHVAVLGLPERQLGLFPKVTIAARDRDFVPGHQEVAAEGTTIRMIPTRSPESHTLSLRMLRMETDPTDLD